MKKIIWVLMATFILLGLGACSKKVSQEIEANQYRQNYSDKNFEASRSIQEDRKVKRRMKKQRKEANKRMRKLGKRNKPR